MKMSALPEMQVKYTACDILDVTVMKQEVKFTVEDCAILGKWKESQWT